ncbi:xanthine phosphoribosyltransferase [Buchnera aphidicola (Kurisakia onigurumii)]|uniref:xanthine phosphoribosyltransferase n=1 Tax=Buchnera aphidicola TaxID=9 RepID=UPI0031B724EB
MIKKYIITWDMLQIYSVKLAKQLIHVKKWKFIIAISRGGLVPAAILARELEIRFVDTICISSYDHDCRKKMKILKKSKDYGNNTLIVDDLIDTGHTAKIIKSLYPKSFFVTIFAKPKGKLLVDKYIIDVSQDIWIEQPWDMKISYSTPVFKLS